MYSLPKAAGVGLRTPHIQTILEQKPAMPWFELMLDNWLAKGGLDTHLLAAICEQYPIAFHGVNLSLGSCDPIDYDYLAKVKHLLDITGAHCYSEHCSFSSIDGKHTPDLLPMPYTEEAAQHISQKISDVQTFLDRRILLENVSCYIESADNQMHESTFIAQVIQQADCDLLLDLNNVYVNSVNHSFNAQDYVNNLPLDKVKEIHLAGFETKQGFLLDCHNNLICAEVWQLFDDVIAKQGPIPTLIEWDNDLPEWSTLVEEQQKAQGIIDLHAPSFLKTAVKEAGLIHVTS